MLGFIVSALLLTVPVVLADPDYRLLHRIYHPSAEEPSNFYPRATLSLDRRYHPELLSEPSASDDFQALLQTAHNAPDALYQLALVPASGDGPWDISSVKAVRTPYDSRPPSS
jgi:hypothetical protein